MQREAVLDLVGAVAVSLCTSALLFGRLAPFSGLIGFVLVAYVVFLGSYVVLVGMHQDSMTVRDRLATVFCASLAFLFVLALAAVALFTFWRGRTALFHLNLFTQDLSSAGPLQPLTIGGIKHAIVGSLEIIGIALVLTVPLGLVCAVYLNESSSRLSRLVRTVVETMTALPSIVAGLFVFSFWELTLHQGPSGFAAAMATTVMMLPILIRTADVVLRLVPGNLKEASAALGAPAWRTMFHVVLPTARSGLTTAVILSMARGIGETAPVLLTAGYTTYLNTDPGHGPMVSLPLVAYELVASPQKNEIARGFACAFVLLVLVVFLFSVARIVGGRPAGRLTGRQAARAQRRSQRDLARFERLVPGAGPTPPSQVPVSTGGAREQATA